MKCNSEATAERAGKEGWVWGEKVKKDNGNGNERELGRDGAGEVKVKVRGVHLLLMVFEHDKHTNECASILLFDGPFCPLLSWPCLHLPIPLSFSFLLLFYPGINQT